MIKFTKHAEEMLIARGISKEKVITCLKNPDAVNQARDDTEVFLKDFGKNMLKVIAIKEGFSYYVITLYWIDKRRIKK